VTLQGDERGAGEDGRSRRRPDVLPRSLPPRGLCREEAARYIGLSPTSFDKLVAEKLMPAPKKLLSRSIWDRRELDLAFDAVQSKPVEYTDWD
jgi:hypothetical protein